MSKGHKFQIYYFFQINDIATSIYNYLSSDDLIRLLDIKLLCNQKVLLKYLAVTCDNESKFRFKFNEHDLLLDKRFYKLIEKLYMENMYNINTEIKTIFPYIKELKIINFDPSIFNNFSSNLDSIKKLLIFDSNNAQIVPIQYPKNLEILKIINHVPNNYPENLKKMEIITNNNIHCYNLPIISDTITITKNNNYSSTVIFEQLKFKKSSELKSLKLFHFNYVNLDFISDYFPNLKKLVANDNYICIDKIPKYIEHFECNIQGTNLILPKNIKYIKSIIHSQIYSTNLESLDSLEYINIRCFKNINFKLPRNIRNFVFNIMSYENNNLNNAKTIWDVSECKKLELVEIGGFYGTLIIPNNLNKKKVINSFGTIINGSDYNYLCNSISYPEIFDNFKNTLEQILNCNKRAFTIFVNTFIFNRQDQKVSNIFINTFTCDINDINKKSDMNSFTKSKIYDYSHKSNSESNPENLLNKNLPLLANFLSNLVNNNYIELLKNLIKFYKVDINIKIENGSTLLHIACKDLNYDMVKFLVKNKIQNSNSNDYETYPIDYLYHNKNLNKTGYKILSYLKNKNYDYFAA